jgi:hypothetical protein
MVGGKGPARPLASSLTPGSFLSEAATAPTAKPTSIACDQLLLLDNLLKIIDHCLFFLKM